jgi:hypothetical protein
MIWRKEAVIEILDSGMKDQKFVIRTERPTDRSEEHSVNLEFFLDEASPFATFHMSFDHDDIPHLIRSFRAAADEMEAAQAEYDKLEAAAHV